MAISIQELCLQAIKAQLDGLIPANPTLTVARGRARPFSAEEAPAINQLDGDDEITDYTSNSELHEIEVAVEGYGTNADFEALQTEMSEFQAQVWQAVKAAEADPNIIMVLSGGAPRDREDESGRQPLLAFTLSALVKYKTAAGDPYSIG